MRRFRFAHHGSSRVGLRRRWVGDQTGRRQPLILKGEQERRSNEQHQKHSAATHPIAPMKFAHSLPISERRGWALLRAFKRRRSCKCYNRIPAPASLESDRAYPGPVLQANITSRAVSGC